MKKCAKLALLDSLDAEKYKNDIEDIILMAEALDEIDVFVDAKETECILREDEVKESFPKEELLKNAPSVCDGFFTVPKIVGE